ncbi:MAG: hypothetical protein Q9220_006114 [cf. Caloplaca sp. 1 TL-2023]
MPDASGELGDSDHSQQIDGVDADPLRYLTDDSTAMHMTPSDAPRSAEMAVSERLADLDQNQWPEGSYEPNDFRSGEADYALHIYGIEDLPDANFADSDVGANPNGNYYAAPSQNMHNNIQAFEQTFQNPLERYVPPSVSFADTPRYTAPAIDADARPWALQAVADGQRGHAPTDAQLFEPEIEFRVLAQHDEVPLPQIHFMTGSDMDAFQESHAAGTNDLVMSDDSIDPPPDPDPVGPPSLLIVRQDTVEVTQGVPGDKMVGGRRRGALKPQNKEHANSTRKKRGQCWPCSLQRNVCESDSEDDEICKGCKSRRKISLIPGCIRVKLPELTTTFIPGKTLKSPLKDQLQLSDRTASLADQHDPKKLRSFASTHVRRWLDNRFLVWVTWGHFRPFKCEVTEIEPAGATLLYQDQNRLNLDTNQYDLVSVPSPPVGMILMDVPGWRTRLKGYVEEALRENFWRLPDVCFQGDDSRVARALLLPIFRYNRSSTGKAQELVHQSLKLVVQTYIMTHSLTLVESTKDDVYNRLQNRPTVKFGIHTCPRWLNKQIKFLFSALHRDNVRDLLKLVQDTLRTADKRPLWPALFAAISVLAMTTESLQVTLRGKEDIDKKEKRIGERDTTANRDVALMDDEFTFLKNLFHEKYRTLLNKGFNPLQSTSDRASLDDAAQSLAAEASDIVTTHRESSQRS